MTITNGVDPADLPPLPAPAPPGERFVLGFVGTLYGDRDAAPVLAALRRLIDALEDSDDVQNVYTNLDITPEVRAELENDEE